MDNMKLGVLEVGNDQVIIRAYDSFCEMIVKKGFAQRLLLCYSTKNPRRKLSQNTLIALK